MFDIDANVGADFKPLKLSVTGHMLRHLFLSESNLVEAVIQSLD
ncbi:hypothetical protein QN395_07690 [Undibacterium sp. RTI2.2]|nr:hypothetical protein [Undibacterium sp. RTI2.2]